MISSFFSYAFSWLGTVLSGIFNLSFEGISVGSIFIFSVLIDLIVFILWRVFINNDR